jgi:hypothetical protein
MSNPKQTTAIQELLEFAEYRRSKSVNSHLGAWNMIIEKIKESLPQEREQIENAFVAGDERGTKDIPFNAEQYFTQTFKS